MLPKEVCPHDSWDSTIHGFCSSTRVYSDKGPNIPHIVGGMGLHCLPWRQWLLGPVVAVAE